MDLEKLAEKIRDLIVGELREEFKLFRASVESELSGYRLAIESMNARMSGIEARMSGIEARMSALEERQSALERRIDETNKRIDETRAELKAEIMQNTQRIDETNRRIDETRAELKAEIMQNTQRIDALNKRVDDVQYILIEINGELKEALSKKEIIKDMLIRIERLEAKVVG
ncbi:hypothetical protein [Thermocrinis sp.]